MIRSTLTPTLSWYEYMGSRTGETAFERAIEKGYRVGIMASGGNHRVPAVFEHGSMCTPAARRTKEAIWDASVKYTL